MHILRQVQWWSVAMDTTYDVISSTWSSHVCVKIHVFSTSFNNKRKSCGLNHAKCLLCVIFHVKLKQLPFLAVLAWFLLRRKIHDGNQDGDYLLVTSWQASSCAITHKIYLILLRRSKAFGFLLKVKLCMNWKLDLMQTNLLPFGGFRNVFITQSFCQWTL